MKFPAGSEWLEMLWTAARTFVVTAIAQVLAYGVGVFDLSAGDWKAVAASGVAAVLMVVVRFLDPSNKSYGVKGGEDA
jgi:hypothetical protein